MTKSGSPSSNEVKRQEWRSRPGLYLPSSIARSRRSHPPTPGLFPLDIHLYAPRKAVRTCHPWPIRF